MPNLDIANKVSGNRDLICKEIHTGGIYQVDLPQDVTCLEMKWDFPNGSYSRDSYYCS